MFEKTATHQPSVVTRPTIARIRMGTIHNDIEHRIPVRPPDVLKP